MLDTSKNVYMLSTWSIERRRNGWFIYPTPFFSDTNQPKGPYSSIMSACLMIARELAREVVRRHHKK